LAEPILARGEYLPDDLMCRILADWLDQPSGGWVLDGFPRSLPQADFSTNGSPNAAENRCSRFRLDVPYEELVSRIRNRVECPECRWSGQNAGESGTDSARFAGHRVVPRADDTRRTSASAITSSSA
jgi:adenylate kinase